LSAWGETAREGAQKNRMVRLSCGLDAVRSQVDMMDVNCGPSLSLTLSRWLFHQDLEKQMVVSVSRPQNCGSEWDLPSPDMISELCSSSARGHSQHSAEVSWETLHSASQNSHHKAGAGDGVGEASKATGNQKRNTCAGIRGKGSSLRQTLVWLLNLLGPSVHFLVKSSFGKHPAQ